MTAVSLLAVLGMSACAPSESDSAPAETTAPPTTSSSAPKVENPKDLKSIADACELLTPEQQAQLQASEPESDTSAYGETQCIWSNDKFAATVAVNTMHGGTAEISENVGSDNIISTEIGGYPAARIGEQDVVCRIEVGVSEDQSLEVDYSKFGGTAPEMQDPCGYAEKIASEALKNVPDA